mmetsp:Transcript_30593/g.90680  ORF Transcript_30593/g.90680 Transcript_30593/m.90680 type:complete len:270 (-) Transcript_30593:355-1164(-)
MHPSMVCTNSSAGLCVWWFLVAASSCGCVWWQQAVWVSCAATAEVWRTWAEMECNNCGSRSGVTQSSRMCFRSLLTRSIIIAFAARVVCELGTPCQTMPHAILLWPPYPARRAASSALSGPGNFRDAAPWPSPLHGSASQKPIGPPVNRIRLPYSSTHASMTAAAEKSECASNHETTLSHISRWHRQPANGAPEAGRKAGSSTEQHASLAPPRHACMYARANFQRHAPDGLNTSWLGTSLGPSMSATAKPASSAASDDGQPQLPTSRPS